MISDPTFRIEVDKGDDEISISRAGPIQITIRIGPQSSPGSRYVYLLRHEARQLAHALMLESETLKR